MVCAFNTSLPQHVAPEFRPVEVLLVHERRRLAEPAERDQQDALALALCRRDRPLEIEPSDRVDAVQDEVLDLRCFPLVLVLRIKRLRREREDYGDEERSNRTRTRPGVSRAMHGPAKLSNTNASANGRVRFACFGHRLPHPCSNSGYLSINPARRMSLLAVAEIRL